VFKLTRVLNGFAVKYCVGVIFSCYSIINLKDHFERRFPIVTVTNIVIIIPIRFVLVDLCAVEHIS
jgi:hypothetical protein